MGVLVAVVRIVWVFGVDLSPPPSQPQPRAARTSAPSAATALVAWSGMRGAVCLAAALAIPLETDAGAPFPERDLLIFLAFCVIVVTLVGHRAWRCRR